ncbi:MAG: 6,7-dimethyl-8-ribityllumazine synthase [Phycisphaerales bacterium]
MVTSAPQARNDADAAGLRVAIIASRYHQAVIDRMLRGAIEAFLARGGADEAIVEFPAPGAFELPVLAGAATRCGAFDAVVVLGCVVKGETRHDEVIADAVANALATLSAGSGVPVGLGLLTVDTLAQAEARAGGDAGNKGQEAMDAALDAALAISAINAAGKESS